jgi:hypothetical protein
MALGDGATWNQALPDEDQPASLYADYDRDLRVGVQGRMAREHIWPASQTATSQGGHHNYVTLQLIASAPTIAGTTGGCIWVKSSDKSLYFINSAGTARTLVHATAGGTLGAIPICSSASPNGMVILVGGSDGLPLIAHSGTAAPAWAKVDHGAGVTGLSDHDHVIYARGGVNNVKIYYGSSSVNLSSTVTVSIGGTMADTTYAAMVMPNMAGNSAFDVNLTITSKTGTTFRVDNEDGNANAPFNWLTVGSGT